MFSKKVSYLYFNSLGSICSDMEASLAGTTSRVHRQNEKPGKSTRNVE